MGMDSPQTAPLDPVDELPPMANARQVAALLGVNEQLLAKWRSLKQGPAYVKLTPGPGGAVRYLREDVREYIASNRQGRS